MPQPRASRSRIVLRTASSAISSGLDASLPGTLAIARSAAASSGASSHRAFRIEGASTLMAASYHSTVARGNMKRRGGRRSSSVTLLRGKVRLHGAFEIGVTFYGALTLGVRE